ncbi:hypothetical protein EDEG_00268 [Edhazardia aedis USNM 41457]|uniref:Uncharacterized protein n=1 Tax=Edhazardia aedis (strain USNM 41457) TaxID=1003232 RepID=J9D4X5_EDHAE|nr:hypothetical protein EDEG_00268 [Edhazardia aedis USNM 41457]|eukprot:EJW02574.1 hypothetical protein EDEG_00268 [Edhazardia aedis USNM 41457]
MKFPLLICVLYYLPMLRASTNQMTAESIKIFSIQDTNEFKHLLELEADKIIEEHNESTFNIFYLKLTDCTLYEVFLERIKNEKNAFLRNLHCLKSFKDANIDEYNQFLVLFKNFLILGVHCLNNIFRLYSYQGISDFVYLESIDVLSYKIEIIKEIEKISSKFYYDVDNEKNCFRESLFDIFINNLHHFECSLTIFTHENMVLEIIHVKIKLFYGLMYHALI